MKNRILTLAILSALATGCAMDTTHTTRLEPITAATPRLTDEQELSDLRKELAGTGIKAFNLGPITTLILQDEIAFKKGGFVVDKKYFTILKSVALVLNKHEKSNVIVAGYAGCNEGSSEAMQRIAEARAIAVANVLVASNVNVGRIEMEGLGDKYHSCDKKRKGSHRDRVVSISLVSANG